MLVIVASIGGCKCSRAAHHDDGRVARVTEAIAQGRTWLGAHQSQDGAWRSPAYGSFRDGDGLTPLVVRALLEAAPDGDVHASAGADWLAEFVTRDDGRLFPVYTAALSVEIFSHPTQAHHHAARDAWLRDLTSRQLTAALGWDPADREYGGWGYALVVPRKPTQDDLEPPLVESNVSATVFALDALAAAGVSPQDRSCAAALVFLDRMQNFADDPDPNVDDGGFHLIYEDPVRNKAGPVDFEHPTERFRSYGSATADGARGFLRCGRDLTDPRVRAAQTWLQKNFEGGRHPGDYTEALEPDRNGLYLYWAASAARTLPMLGVGNELGPGRRWANELADGVLRYQRPDGSFSNPVPTVRENDEVVATATALSALARLRPYLTDDP